MALPVSASTMPSAAAVKTAAAVEAAATMKTTAAMKAACRSTISATYCAVVSAHRPTRVPTSADKAATAIVSASAVIAAAPVVAGTPTTASPISVIPRSGTDEDSPSEPVRSVIAVGCASIRIIIVVAVVTDRRSADVSRAKPYTYADSNLSLRVSQRQH